MDILYRYQLILKREQISQRFLREFERNRFPCEARVCEDPAPERRYSVRALTQADAAAFAAFQARCSERDLNESEIGVDQEAPYGVFDGDRIVAGASAYMWDGLADVGVLTDPEYRGQGLGKAAVSAVCAHFVDNADEPRIVCYRHAANNLASQGVARGVGFSFYADFECVHRES